MIGGGGGGGDDDDDDDDDDECLFIHLFNFHCQLQISVLEKPMATTETPLLVTGL